MVRDRRWPAPRPRGEGGRRIGTDPHGAAGPAAHLSGPVTGRRALVGRGEDKDKQNFLFSKKKKRKDTGERVRHGDSFPRMEAHFGNGPK